MLVLGDIRHPEGNLLLAHGFTRVRPPEGVDGSSCYTLEPKPATQLLLWGFGIYVGREGAGGLFLDRFRCEPRLLEAPIAPAVWRKEQLPAMRRAHGPDRERVAVLLANLIGWIIGYELPVAGGRTAIAAGLCVSHPSERVMRASLVFSLCVALLLSACSTPAAPGPPATVTREASAAASATQATTAAPAAPVTGSGELRIGTGLNVPTSMLATEGTNGFNMVTYGAGEALMRLSPEQELIPWLAEAVERADETTWEVTLRPGVTFHDGTPLTAQAVADSFASSWASMPNAGSFVPTDTQILVRDELRLSFTTPEPLGNFRYSLANWNFVIHKPPVDGISPMTGPYRPVSLVVDQEFVLERFADYWGGGPALERIRVVRLPDANARALALQSGDVDMLTNVAPEIARSLPPEIEQVSIPGARLHHIILNHTRAPFDERAVREAASLAINREALLQATLDGQGEAAVNLYPASLGLSLVEAQRTDLERARELLDEAGWVVGADGVREKGGQRLELLLYSYPGRPELTQMAIAIQAMLGEAGFAVAVEEVADVVEMAQGGDFQATMFSVGVQSDPLYMPAIALAEGGSFNYGGYRSAQIEALVAQLRVEDEPAARAELARQVQEVVRIDTPNIYLATPPLITAFREGSITGFTPSPNDLYLVTPELGLGQ